MPTHPTEKSDTADLWADVERPEHMTPHDKTEDKQLESIYDTAATAEPRDRVRWNDRATPERVLDVFEINRARERPVQWSPQSWREAYWMSDEDTELVLEVETRGHPVQLGFATGEPLGSLYRYVPKVDDYRADGDVWNLEVDKLKLLEDGQRLRELYTEQYYSIRDLAELSGESTRQVQKALKRFGIETRSEGRPKGYSDARDADREYGKA